MRWKRVDNEPQNISGKINIREYFKNIREKNITLFAVMSDIKISLA